MRTLLRLIGLLLLAAAVVAAVIDGTRSIADHALLITPLEQSWREVSPSSLEGVRDMVARRLGEAVWDLGTVPMLRLPTAGVFAVLALVFLLLGRARRDLLS